MAVTRAQKVRLGAFLAIGITAVVGGLVVLAGAKLGEKRDAYTVRYDQAEVSLSGLEVGSPVRYSGIKVGRVDAIGIDPKGDPKFGESPWASPGNAVQAVSKFLTNAPACRW